MFTSRKIEGMLQDNYIAHAFGEKSTSYIESDWQKAETDRKNVCENISEIIAKKCLIYSERFLKTVKVIYMST